MTPTELEVAVTKTEDLVLAACPVTDPGTGLPVDKRSTFGYLMHDLRFALDQYGAAPEAVAQYLIGIIKSVPPFADPRAPGYSSGWQHIGSEGFTTLASHFAPKGTKHKGPTPAEIKANAMATGNVQGARDGKAFLGLDGAPYDQYTAGYKEAREALLAAASASPAPAPGPPPGVGAYPGPERRVSGVIDRRGAASTGGGTISPGHGIA